MSSSVGQTKKFGKGQRTVPKPDQKAQKWYPVDDEPQPKKVSTPVCDLRCDGPDAFFMNKCDNCAGRGVLETGTMDTR